MSSTLKKADKFFILGRLYDLPGIKFASKRMDFPGEALEKYESIPVNERQYYKIIQVFIFPSGWGGMRPLSLEELRELRRCSGHEQLKMFH